MGRTWQEQVEDKTERIERSVCFLEQSHTAAELAAHLGLTAHWARRTLRALEAAGRVRMDGAQRRTHGPPAITYRTERKDREP